jgi:hypothetical protein
MAKVVFEKDLELDGKKRGVLTGAEYRRYHMKRFDDGSILLEPRVLADPREIPAETLARLDRAAKNFKKREVSEPVDPADVMRRR